MIYFIFLLLHIALSTHPQLDALQQQINYHTQMDLILTRQRQELLNNFTIDQQILQSLMYNISTVENFELAQFVSQCHIFENASSLKIITTMKSTYIGVNAENKKKFNIYNSQCDRIASFSNVSVEEVVCDKGVCLDDVFFISDNGIVFTCNEDDHFANCVDLLHMKEKIEGAALRISSTNQKQIILAHEKGIKIYNGLGILKDDIGFGLHGSILKMKDHYPHPVIISDQGWIYYFNTFSYAIQISKCPYVPGMKNFHISNSYDTIIYAFSDFVLYMLELKSFHQKCTIVGSHTEMKQIPLADAQENKGNIYIKNRIINPMSHTSYESKECEGRPIVAFQFKKTQKISLLLMGCCEDNNCWIKLSRELGSSSSKYSLLFTLSMMVIFFLFMVCFIKSLRKPEFDHEEWLINALKKK